ncbi:unnamed protein product [Durusdinium trenchii]
MLTSESKVEEAFRISMMPWLTFTGVTWLFLYCYAHLPSFVVISLSTWATMCLCTLLAMYLRPKAPAAQGKHGLVVVLSLFSLCLGTVFGYWNYSRAGGVGDYWAIGSHEIYEGVSPSEPADARRDAAALAFTKYSRPDARLSTSYAAFGQLGPERASTGIGLEGIDFGRMLRMLIVLLVSWRMLRGKFQICEKQVMSFNHSSLKCQESSLPKEGRCLPCRSETHWPDGAPKRFRGKDAWKSWINWESPFNGSSDQLNRERKFFWEVDDKGALWRLELHEPGRWGEMRHPKVDQLGSVPSGCPEEQWVESRQCLVDVR